jgi:hypothetical protein
VGNMLLNVHSDVPGVYSSFTQRNIALAYIDLGCACRFPAGSDPATWLGTGHWGTMDHAAPEIPRARGDRSLSASQPYQLPPVDVRAFCVPCATNPNLTLVFCFLATGVCPGIGVYARPVMGAHILQGASVGSSPVYIVRS